MNLAKLSKWVLVVAGLLWAYKGLTNVDLVADMLGGLEMVVALVVGLAALYLAYHMLTMKKGKK